VAGPAGKIAEWKPKKVLRVIKVLKTSAEPAHVVTELVEAFIKALGNPQGQHSLVCELVGTRLAAWLGLPTFEMALLDVPAKVIQFADGTYAIPGPAVATKFENGDVWSGRQDDLKDLVNPQTIPGLVVFDTWTRNNDRFCRAGGDVRENLRNVFLSSEEAPRGKFRLLAIDHTACFRCEEGEITSKVGGICRVKDPRIFGLFPAFVEYCTKEAIEQFLQKLSKLDEGYVKKVVAEVPQEWQLSSDRRQDLTNFICDRARYLLDTLVQLLTPLCGWNTKSSIQ